MNQRDRLLLKKVVMFCERIASNLNKCGNFETFQQEYLYQDQCVCKVQS